MPYAMRLRALAELRAVTNHLILRHGYRTKLPKPTFAELGRDGITVDRLLAALYADSWHTDKTKGHPVPDTYNVTSEDRKSVVKGKSVSAVVDLGGRRIIKKKKTQKQTA